MNVNVNVGLNIEINKDALWRSYEKVKESGLALDLTRGKPGKSQLDLSMGMLDVVKNSADCVSDA